ncbi:MAG: hypothetical protein Q7T11_00905, partial [Deltaproteobacteria bacterium]|nr:hypothetical protein [Deltaproteobacteria bacterium]
MPLTLLHGPAGAGKSTEILRLATQRNIHDPFPDSFFFIVPTASAAETIRQKFLALKKTPGLFIGEQVTTFDRFLLALLKNNLPRVHLAEMSFVRNLIRTLLFSNSYPSLEEIRPFASTPEALAATFLGLKRNGVGPEEARALFARHKTDRLKDFIQIFSDYQALISRLHYFDSGELTLSALKLLRRGELKLPQSVTSLYIDRLFPVTLGQREILKELVKNFPHLDVTLSYSFDYQSADDPHLYPAYGFLGELAETSRYFRGPSPGPQPALLRFANPAHEVQWLIRQIAETLSSGVMPEEIGVVLPSHPYYWEKLCGRKDPVAKSLSLSAAREDFEIAWNFENDLLEGKLAPSWKEDELKKIGPTPLPSPLGIKWLTLSEAPSFNFKKVFIVGFTASLFPELATDHPFFTPEMRQSPEMREILGNPAYQWNLAKNWLAQTLARSEEAVLTYPASLWGNREQLPSRLLACHPEPSLCHPEPQAKD